MAAIPPAGAALAVKRSRNTIISIGETMKLSGLFLLAGLITACQNTVHWQAPEDGKTATLVFTSHHIAAQPMICRSNQGFVPTREALDANPIDPELFADDQAGEGKGEVLVRVPAGTPVTLGVRFDPENPDRAPAACTARARFTPEAGQRYQAEFVMPGTQCGLSITDDRNRAVAEANRETASCP